jgi:hypothetical protein
LVLLIPTARLIALDSQLPVLLALALLLLQSSLQMLLAVLGAVLGALLPLLQYALASRTALRPLAGARDVIAGKEARASSGW